MRAQDAHSHTKHMQTGKHTDRQIGRQADAITSEMLPFNGVLSCTTGGGHAPVAHKPGAGVRAAMVASCILGALPLQGRQEGKGKMS
jgi:hypothetical protein